MCEQLVFDGQPLSDADAATTVPVCSYAGDTAIQITASLPTALGGGVGVGVGGAAVGVAAATFMPVTASGNTPLATAATSSSVRRHVLREFQPLILISFLPCAPDQVIA